MIVRNPKYKPLYTSRKRYFLITGGRGSGKSFEVGTFLSLLTYEAYHRILFTRYTMTSAELSIIPSFHDKIDRLEAWHQFESVKSVITNKFSGSDIVFKGIKTSSGNQTANLKSLEGVSTWVLDEAEELVDVETFDKLDLSLRTTDVQNRVIMVMNPTTREHWVWQRFFENNHRIEMVDGCPVPICTHPDVCHIHTTYLDNIANLSQSFIDTIERIKQEDPQRYAHEIIGGWQLQPEGVLYQESELKRFRKSDVRYDEAHAIYGYGDVADEGTDSLCFPIGYLFPNRVYIPEVVFTDEDINQSLPRVVSAIRAQTHYDKDKRIKKSFDYARIESNNQGSAFIKMLRQYIDASKILGVSHATNKITRINLAKRFVTNYCYFLANEDIVPGSDYDKFMKGILSFLKDGKSPHDDAPDGLSGLAVMCESFSPELFEPLPIDFF